MRVSSLLQPHDVVSGSHDLRARSFAGLRRGGLGMYLHFHNRVFFEAFHSLGCRLKVFANQLHVQFYRDCAQSFHYQSLHNTLMFQQAV